jgi:catechol 2,3-dioxygenase-like lactoylglutathione lyase family enzyme
MPIDVRGLAPLLQVFDMPTSIRFYRDGLGFLIVETDGKPIPENDWLLLELHGCQLMLNTAYERDHRPPQPDPARIAAHQDTCIYFGCPDVDGAYAQLRERGVDLKPPEVAWYGMKQLYLRDPDGFGICFQWKAKPEEMPKAAGKS